ncbi:MAG: GTP 3',8-cyclase MoaA [Planctomycetota bacterium]
MLDTLGRPLRSLRVSVTDRCNLRCAYCMPEEEYRWLERAEILRYGELAAIVDAFCALGVERVRITGGEPLVRCELERFVEQLARRPAIRDLALTTNGLLLEEQAPKLAAAGLHRVTVSLDTLAEDVFERLTRRKGLPDVLRGIEAARAHWPGRVKLDTVVLRGTNDGEVERLLEFARERGLELRYIEYMDVGGATRWSMGAVVSRAELLERLARRFGPIEPLVADSSAPAERFRLADGTVFGIIASTTAPFCRTCDRSRLTADGQWYLCLYARLGIDLKALLRGGATTAELAARIASVWNARADRGAEERLAAHARGPLADATTLRGEPHLEMHTRGG